MLCLHRTYIEHVIMWILFTFVFVYIWFCLCITYDIIMWKAWTKFKNFWDIFLIEFQISSSCNSCIFKRKKISDCLYKIDMYHIHDIKQFDHVTLCIAYVLHKHVTFFFHINIFIIIKYVLRNTYIFSAYSEYIFIIKTKNKIYMK